jgi:hypothetical protein
MAKSELLRWLPDNRARSSRPALRPGGNIRLTRRKALSNDLQLAAEAASFSCSFVQLQRAKVRFPGPTSGSMAMRHCGL